MATRSFVCVSLYIVWILLLYLEVCAARSCPPGRFCPIDTNCTGSTTSCVIVCATESDHLQQGNHLTGNCERLPDGTDHWMDSTYYEIFILSDQTLNTSIRDISFISTDQFQTNDFSYVNLVEDITFTLNGSCPYFYFTNTLKKEVVFENYYDYYVPDDIESVSLALAEPVPPDDYEMEVIVTDSGSVLERRDIVVHVRDVLRVPCMTSSELTFVNFSATKYDVSKSAGSLVVTLVTSTIMSSQSFIIGVIAEADNSSEYPATAGVDFTPGRYNATFTPGATTATTSIPIIAGNYGEVIKQFSLRLFIDGAAYEQCVFSGNVSTAAVHIIPGLIVDFAAGQFIGSESSGFIEVIVRITGGSSSTPITVTITPSVRSPVSASGSGVDFNSNPFNITIDAGATDGRANVSVTCDDEVEGLESFDMTLTLTSSSSGVTLGRSTCEGQITDSTVVVNFNQASYRVTEDDSSLNIMMELSQTSSVQFQVMISTVDVTAIAGEDYSGNSLPVNFVARVTVQPLTINIINNHIVECNETFNVTIVSATTCGVTIGSTSNSEVMISDNDGVTVSLSQSQYLVAESDNSLTGIITLSSRASEDVIVEVTISDGSANAGVDYAMSTALVFNVTIPAVSRSSSFSIDIINDMIQEGNETFNISIRLLPSCLSLSLGTSSSTVTIIDDEVAVIAFSSPTYDGLESSGVVSATIIISGVVVSSKDIIVTISFTPATASGSDFNTTTQTATIIAGINRSIVNVSVTDDNIVEGNETFNMSLTVPSSLGPGVTTGDITSATATIIDTTRIAVSFVSSQYNGSEAVGFVLVTLELINGTSANTFNVSVNPSELSPVSAEGDFDFNTTTLIATFASGANTSNVSVQVISDIVGETDESFELKLSVPMSLSPAITAGENNRATGIIIDSSMLRVEFTSGQFVGSESSGFIEVIVRIRDGTSSTPITVTITPSVQSPVSASGSGVDFNSNSFNITINVGATEGRANVSVTCDDEVEGLESFDMRLTLTSSSTGITLGRDTCEGQINDSTVVISFSQSSYGVTEDNGSVTIMMLLSQKSSVQFTVNISTIHLTATDTEDYDAVLKTLTIPAGVVMQPFMISIINDNIVECNETFNATIISVDTCTVKIGSARNSEVMIRDDDGATVSLSQSQYSVVESNNSLTGTITLSSRASEDVIVEVTISDGSANAGVDYAMSTALVFHVTISAGSTSSSFSIDIINDMIQEANETFNIVIRLLPNCLSLSLGTSSSTVIIIDDEVLTVEFSMPVFAGSESSGILTVTLLMKGGVSDINISVIVKPSDQFIKSAEGNGVDYISTFITATFPAGTNSTTINVPINKDNIAEESETFDLSFTIPSSFKAVFPGKINRANGTIIDNTTITVSFIHTSYTINEDDGQIHLMLFFSNPSSTVITILVEDTNINATGGVDYISGPYNVTFPAEATVASFDVNIINDNILERNESFTLTIAMDSLPSKVTTNVTIAHTTVVVIDNDIATISFNQAQYSVEEESGALKPILLLSDPSSYNINIQIGIINGNTSGNDYTFGPYNVNIPAGLTRVQFDVPITNDNILESNETFILNIMSNSVPDKLIISDPRESTVTIVDNDTLTVQFSSATFTASESTGNISVTLSLEGGTSASDITVIVTPYNQQPNGPAQAQGNGVDYTSNPVNATFPAGTITATINIPITNDSHTEELETFDLRITVPPPTDRRLSVRGITTAVGRIFDRSVLVVELASSKFIGNESSEFVNAVITKSNALSVASINVLLTLTGISATGSGVDFNSNPINAVLPPEDTATIVSIPVVCDRLTEETEMFNITLEIISATHIVTLGLGRNQSIGVIEDSTVDVNFDQLTYTINEDTMLLSPVIILSQPSPVTLTLSINLIDVNTTEADYDQQSIVVTINPGILMQQFTVNIINDNLVECTEAFNLSISTERTWCGLNSSNGSAQVIIIDNDVGVVNIIQPPLSVKEAIGSFVISMLLNATAFEDITILTTMTNVTASVELDFSHTRLSSQLTPSISAVNINSGSLSGSTSISITNDTVQEYNETFNVNMTLQLQSRCLPITLVGETFFTITIIDDEELTVQFNQMEYSGRESSEVIIVTLSLLGGTASKDFNVNVSALPVSATGGIDYDNATKTATFYVGQIFANVTIPIVDDYVVDEEDEIISLTFELIPTTGVRVDPGIRPNATAIIIDTTPPQMYLHPVDKIIRINNDSTSTALICIANGSSSYYWQRKDGSIQLNAEGITSNNLILRNILPSDSGQYRCVAINDHGRNYSDYATLTVEAIPPVVSILHNGEILAEEIHAEKGDRIQLNCLATGVGMSDFKYQWFLNNGPPIAATSTLVVSPISESNTGDYTCSVQNPYGGIGRSSNATLILNKFCNPVTVSYDRFNITWNETLVGITAVAPCTGPGLGGNVSRRCIVDDRWEETNSCFNEKTAILFDQITNLTMSLSDLNETETIAEAGTIANSLANVTSSTNDTIYPADIGLAVNTLSALNNVTESVVANLTADDALFEDTTSVLNNLLSDTNQDSWEQLERTSPATSQDLVSGAEQVTKLLSATLTAETTTAIKTKPNIVLKAERVSNDSVDKGYVFPAKDDNLTSYTGRSAQLSVPSGLLQDISTNSNKDLTIASTVIRDGSGLRLSSSDNETGAPQVPASPIFSLQIDPPPDPDTLEKNPITMMFDVALPPSPSDDSLGESSVQNQQNLGVQNEQNFGVQNQQSYELDDVTCNFYDYSLVTNNLNKVGGWSTDGLTLDRDHSNKTSVTCNTTHLTSFAVLVSIQDERPPSKADKALSIISYIGCSISLVCLCVSIMFLAYTMYKSKEKKINHLFIHLNLCIALALGLIVFIAGIENATSSEAGCKFVAALLQYLFISAFCWMLCEGVMLYMMLVTVFGNKFNTKRFFFILGWSPAIPIVAISAGIAHEHYGTDHYCWIKSDDGAIAAFIVPIGTIMLINCVFFAITLKVLWANQRKTKSEQSTNLDTVKDLMKAVIVLLPLLGMTWIIGILAVNNETQVFAWIFAILNSLQGVFIFVFHVMRNKQVSKELRERYTFMRRTVVFRRVFSSTRGSGDTSTIGITSKARTSASSDVSGRGKKMSTTSFGSSVVPGGDYFSTTLERRLSKDKSEALDENVFEDDNQIKMTTFRKVNESIIEENEVGWEEKQTFKDNHDVDEEDNKSITEKAIEEEKKSNSEEEKKSITEEDGATVEEEKNGAAATTKPTPLPRTIK